MLKWPAMNDRERQQLDLKLRNRRAEFEAARDEFRASNPVFRQSDEDNWSGRPIRKELEQIAGLLTQFAKAVMTDARGVSKARAAFDKAKGTADCLKHELAPHTDWLIARLDRHKTDERNASKNRRAIRSAQKAWVEIDRIIAEAEFDFDLDEHPPQPSEKAVKAWIKNCPTNNSKAAWRLVKDQKEMPRPSKAFFEACWVAVHGKRTRGRPPKEVQIREISDLK